MTPQEETKRKEDQALLDEFAKLAMSAFLSPVIPVEFVAEWAYNQAEAMMIERAKRMKL